MSGTADVFHVYEDVGKDGYPREWHRLLYDDLGIGVLTEREPGIKHLVREQAGHRCVRCGHPYVKGAGEWSPCDALCTHGPPLRSLTADGRVAATIDSFVRESVSAERLADAFRAEYDWVEAQWMILTVHHLNGDKADCRWWNLASLCQRCHLRIQRTVVMPRVFPWEHSEWFKPYAAGWYAHAYLGEDLSRGETMARLDELLALERVA